VDPSGGSRGRSWPKLFGRGEEEKGELALDHHHHRERTVIMPHYELIAIARHSKDYAAIRDLVRVTALHIMDHGLLLFPLFALLLSPLCLLAQVRSLLVLR
jgi:hypothetical protein